MNKMKLWVLSGLLLTSSLLYAADINDSQWTLRNIIPKLTCTKAVSYLVNGGNTDILVNGSFENGDEIYFVIPAKSSHALDYAILSHSWFSRAIHKSATVTVTSAVNGEQLFSGSVKTCENIVVTGPVRLFTYQMNCA
jgi:hypothetical protein